MKKVFYLLDIFVASVNKNIAVAGMALGVLLAFVNVVLRYVFGTGLTWAGELTNYLFIWSALFGAAYGFKKGIHISVTVMLSALPKALAKFLFVVANMISFIYLTVSAYFGYQVIELLRDIEETSVDLNIPMWIPNLVLPIAFGAAAFRAGEKVIEVMQTDASEVLAKNEEEVVRDSVVKE